MSDRRRGADHAVVLGGSLAGLLTAHVLSRQFEAVTIVERDTLPESPRHRKGLPQARHVHLLWSGGARIIEELLPGTTARLLDAGAHRVGVPEDMVTLSSHGWQYRFPASQFAIMCSRPLLDWVIRDRVLSAGRVQLRHRTEAVELMGDRKRVVGAIVREADRSASAETAAEVVVDATGRGSRLERWLSALGSPAPEEDVVDLGIGYATRIFQAPPGATATFPAITILADYRAMEPGRNGMIYPIEDGRWITTLSGTRGTKLPNGEQEFRAFARNLRHPIIADLIDTATPLTPVFTSRTGVNRRLYPEQLEEWPDGLLVVGDSLASFNPVYGHGMSAAACSAAALDDALAKHDGGTGRTAELQRSISAAVDDPWIMAASRDICFVDCHNLAKDPRLTIEAAARRQFTDFVSDRMIRDAEVSRLVTGVTSLSAPQTELSSPEFLSLMKQGNVLPPLSEPPLRRDELAHVGLARAGTVEVREDGGVPGPAESVRDFRQE